MRDVLECARLFMQIMSVTAVEGTWIVFTPFLPCLLWAVVIRSKWLATRDDRTEDGGGSDSKPKEE